MPRPGLAEGFRRDQRGVSAIEFALVAPVLLVVYAGSTEVSSAMLNERRVSHAIAVIGDLSAQNQQLTRSKVTDIFAAGTIIMQPYPTAPLNLRVTSVTQNAAGAYVVGWSHSQGSGLPAYRNGRTLADTSMPAGIMVKSGDTVIIAEGSYAYTSPIAYMMPSAMTFSNTFYFHPRFPGSIPCSNC